MHFKTSTPSALKLTHRLFTVSILILAAFVSLLPLLNAGEPGDEAQTVANGPMLNWLQEMDAASYAQSWTDAAPLFQKAITSEGWVTTSQGVRDPLGKCLSRKLASAARQTIPVPGSAAMPAGDYVIAQFETSFAGLKYARETVSFMKTPEGVWKAAGYYIKPG